MRKDGVLRSLCGYCLLYLTPQLYGDLWGRGRNDGGDDGDGSSIVIIDLSGGLISDFSGHR